MNTANKPELVDVSSLTSIDTVTAHLELLTSAENECRQNINQLMNDELENRALSHAETIHDLKQRRTVIEFQILYLRSRLSRLQDEQGD